eukprot:CAMPEP_0117008440 /NCGR_PEP_ID=MMETSP0472-20121206/7948_1 /TAXON_ID=693140 ORGANISM="Tiarina fusus, Strain LIS" /NCGR_SAMPLE_ID=MMETSP0472 /ASSEMBLY_ACC=CAM_ASM_000603 /LENGTH=117 /DNA_ID=CAMNT_0004710467 /DNA_START=220 /DNA_END=574 /DNA_ORIENTATION=+
MKYKTILREKSDASRDGNKTVAAVSFGPVQVREHERVLLEDAGLGMSWEYSPCRVFSSVDEHYCETKPSSPPLPLKTSLRLSSIEERTQLLCSYGFTEEEIYQASRDDEPGGYVWST